jgi:hypothetical protein
LLTLFIFLGVFLALFFYHVFGRFVTSGVKKHEKQPKKNIWAHQNKCVFFPAFFFLFFSLSIVLLDLFVIYYCVLGRFVTRGTSTSKTR